MSHSPVLLRDFLSSQLMAAREIPLNFDNDEVIVTFRHGESNKILDFSLIVTGTSAHITSETQDSAILCIVPAANVSSFFESSTNAIDIDQLRIYPPDQKGALKNILEVFDITCIGDITFDLFSMGFEPPQEKNPFRQDPCVFSYEKPSAWQPLQFTNSKNPALKDFVNDCVERVARNFHPPTSGLANPFCSTAFNDNQFMWDSGFIGLVGRYLASPNPLLGGLDNFYSLQTEDGSICREVDTLSGAGRFGKDDARGSGPNVLGWLEWQNYLFSGDTDRLRAVIPSVISFHTWWSRWRTWSNGGLWSTGWASGMDNQGRIPDSDWHHGWAVWVDATIQQAVNAKSIANILQVLDDDTSTKFDHEFNELREYINNNLWDESTGFFYDLLRNGNRSAVKTAGAFWALHESIAQGDRASKLTSTLRDGGVFSTHNPIPSLASDSPEFSDQGTYWKGGVWSPLNYVVLSGLRRIGQSQLAHEIAKKHVNSVFDVWKESGTLWENYQPNTAAPGIPAKPNFTGWSALSAINILVEFVLGIEWQGYRSTLVLHPTQEDSFSIQLALPGAAKTTIRKDGERVHVTSSEEISVEIAGANLNEPISAGNQGRDFELSL